ncbi:hypothetical protein ACWEOW_11235 [Monashia sp. NPDC004114]
MATPDEFARECDEVARSLRRVPSELRRALASEVKTEVATPLAARVAAAAAGPYARPLSGAVKARALADPTIVIGGSRKVVSGGASPRQLIYGTEWGGGKRRSSVTRRTRHGSVTYKRRSTNQFVPAHPFVFDTIAENADWVLDRFADITLKVLDREVGNG